ncbi:MAG: restriction endonuclease subunit S [Paludibacter sp.]
MKRYETYKPSGIEWLGEIPGHWEVKRVKDCSQINQLALSDKTAIDYQFKYIDIGNVNHNGIVQEPELISFEEAPSRARRIIRENDVIVSTVRTYLKAIAFINFNPKDYIVSTGFAVLSHFSMVNPRFLSYHSQSENFIDNVIRFSTGVSYPAINSQVISALHIIFPSFSDQTAIANYLDTKTAAIDRKIELLTTKADKYKALRRTLINETVCRGLNPNAQLKHSGVKWIGMIPEHWEVKRVKDQLELLTGNSISDKTDYEDSNNSIPYVATKDIEINSCKIDYENGIYIPKDELKNFRTINFESILLCIEGGSAGKKIAFNTRKICFVNKLCSFSSKGKAVYLKYNFYQMQSAPWLFQFNQVLNGLIGGVSTSLLKTFRLIAPPIEEQQEIAAYLDEKTTQIDTILTNIGEQINKLTQLRKTLINDVVTGQLKVTE